MRDVEPGIDLRRPVEAAHEEAGHTNLDFFDTIQAEDLMKNAVVMASYAYLAAMHETRMPRKTGK